MTLFLFLSIDSEIYLCIILKFCGIIPTLAWHLETLYSDEN